MRARQPSNFSCKFEPLACLDDMAGHRDYPDVACFGVLAVDLENCFQPCADSTTFDLSEKRRQSITDLVRGSGAVMFDDMSEIVR